MDAPSCSRTSNGTLQRGPQHDADVDAAQKMTILLASLTAQMVADTYRFKADPTSSVIHPTFHVLGHEFGESARPPAGLPCHHMILVLTAEPC